MKNITCIIVLLLSFTQLNAQTDGYSNDTCRTKNTVIFTDTIIISPPNFPIDTLDTDGDGITDYGEGDGDTDGDGNPNISDTYGSWPNGGGSNPGNLGQDLRKMNTGTVNLNGGNALETNCN